MWPTNALFVMLTDHTELFKAYQGQFFDGSLCLRVAPMPSPSRQSVYMYMTLVVYGHLENYYPCVRHFSLRYLFVQMRRSAAPSQKAGGLPPVKRTKFSTPFMSGNDHSHESVLEIPSSINEDRRVSMPRREYLYMYI